MLLTLGSSPIPSPANWHLASLVASRYRSQRDRRCFRVKLAGVVVGQACLRRRLALAWWVQARHAQRQRLLENEGKTTEAKTEAEAVVVVAETEPEQWRCHASQVPVPGLGGRAAPLSSFEMVRKLMEDKSHDEHRFLKLGVAHGVLKRAWEAHKARALLKKLRQVCLLCVCLFMCV